MLARLTSYGRYDSDTTGHTRVIKIRTETSLCVPRKFISHIQLFIMAKKNNILIKAIKQSIFSYKITCRS
jgi:hypothetical protein